MAGRHSNGDMRSASFSEYLNHDIVEESGGRDSADSFPRYELPLPAPPRKNGPRDREIDVFDAKKYFNSNSDDTVPPVTRDRKESHVDIPERMLGSPRGMSGTRSGPGSPSRHQKKNGSRRQAILSGFTCRGLCSDSKSVQVSEESQIKKPDSPRHVPDKNPSRSNVPARDKSEKFEFPVLSKAETVAVKEQPRKSREVSVSEGKSIGGDEVAVHLQRKLVIATWDAIPRPQPLPLPPGANAYRVEEAESCTSSDLFEIESVSAVCRDGISRPAWSGAPPEKETQKRPGSGSSRFSLSGFKSQKPGSVVAEPGKETRLK